MFVTWSSINCLYLCCFGCRVVTLTGTRSAGTDMPVIQATPSAREGPVVQDRQPRGTPACGRSPALQCKSGQACVRRAGTAARATPSSRSPAWQLAQGSWQEVKVAERH